MGRGWGSVKWLVRCWDMLTVSVTLKVYHHVNDKVIRQVHQKYSPLKELTTIDTSARTQLTESLSV